MSASSAARPRDASIHAALGLAYAGLGRKREAIREADLAIELSRAPSRAATAMMGIGIETFGLTGELDRAFEMIELMLSMQSGREITLPFLRVWPGFDPLRNDPRFDELLRRFTEPG
jgi:serine/threonine-protein kinase